MAGTEETTEAQVVDDSPSSTDGNHSDRPAQADPLDEGIRNLAISELHSRVHTGRTWRAQGMVEGEPLEIVRDACREFLEATEKEAVQLAATPYVPTKKPCADCKGTDTHKATCPQMRR